MVDSTAWITPSSFSLSSQRSKAALTRLPLQLFHDDASSIVVAAAAESGGWRQYVPLVVSLGVITDIALGRPLANAVMAPLQGIQDELKKPQDESARRKERVDTEAIAQQALNQAYASMELRDFLERNKTDEQRMQEIRNKMDREMSQVDQVLKDRQAKLDAGEY